MSKDQGYQPKTGAKCGCKRGVQRDNCPTCEGTGMVIDFRAIRERSLARQAERERAAPKPGDYCVQCKQLVTLTDLDNPKTVIIQGEVTACCASYDEDDHHFNATCSDCCRPNHLGPDIWEGKSTGGGWYERGE